MRIQAHVRNTMLAGLFAVLPIVVTAAILVYIEQLTNDPIVRLIGFRVPGLGVLLCVIVIYLSGLLVTSLVGKWFVRVFDRIMERIPLVKDLYAAWKQISYTPGGGEGIYGKVVLVPSETAGLKQIGFSTGTPLSDGGHVCVFVPNSPNPVLGRVVFVPPQNVVVLDMSVEEGFKLLLSSGNYVPPELVEMKSAQRPYGG